MSGLFIIVSSPSGGGKNSVINALIQRLANATRLVTTTSRPPRPGDEEGVDYYFISRAEFAKRIEDKEFLEYNSYAGNYYGTQRGVLDRLLKNHDVVFSQIEVNGKHHLDAAGVENVSIFLLPEDLLTLRRRIENRGGLTNEQIESRLAIASGEIEASKDYDFRVVNKEGEMAGTVEKIAEFIEKIRKEKGLSAS